MEKADSFEILNLKIKKRLKHLKLMVGGRSARVFDRGRTESKGRGNGVGSNGRGEAEVSVGDAEGRRSL